ncbi:hypothetical protein [Deinococcus kurensis]|uniref:hypothetical protein n=1 Tax=Deinococcus kurensis TaxID=2662757 RepID=UPI0012D2FA0C|nr:hypothetical protein [Deinococcus kurensis]
MSAPTYALDPERAARLIIGMVQRQERAVFGEWRAAVLPDWDDHWVLACLDPALVGTDVHRCLGALVGAAGIMDNTPSRFQTLKAAEQAYRTMADQMRHLRYDDLPGERARVAGIWRALGMLNRGELTPVTMTLAADVHRLTEEVQAASRAQGDDFALAALGIHAQGVQTFLEHVRMAQYVQAAFPDYGCMQS